VNDISGWPAPPKAAAAKARAFEQIRDIVGEIRFVKNAIRGREGLTLYHSGEPFLSEHAELIAAVRETGAAIHLITDGDVAEIRRRCIEAVESRHSAVLRG
jgi:wyosine [tRNA(Phe)-imidazoG37] synthetase (radical SAM superfamily)